MTAKIDPTAVVDPAAEIHDGVEIGPYCTVGPRVTLMPRVKLISHVTVSGRTSIGEDCVVHPFAALGFAPQDFKYKGEDTRLIIGRRNVMREHVTMHPGTGVGRGETRVGDDGYFMIGAHVAHDCILGDRVVFANNGTLGGYVQVGDFVMLGGLAAVHQYCRIGRHAFVAGGAILTHDVIPFGMVQGNIARLMGLNLVGLKRRGFSRRSIHDLRAAYRLLFAREGTFKERIEDARELFSDRPEVMEIVDFVSVDADRPLCLPGRD